MNTIAELLAHAKTSLINTSTTPSLDAELLLAYILQKPRSFLFAHPETVLDQAKCDQYKLFIQQHQQGKPIAYITGHKEFWSLDLIVNEKVLIPRPETELLVELTLEFVNRDCTHLPATIADLGVGSGAIALALARERPHWKIYGTDINPDAIKLAQENAQKFKLNQVTFIQGEWCQPLPKIKFDAIVSNPPYIAIDDPALEEAVSRYEPKNALIAAENGLQAIKEISVCARHYLKEGGLLLLEHGYQQHEAVKMILKQDGYHAIKCFQDLAGLDRVTIAYNHSNSNYT